MASSWPRPYSARAFPTSRLRTARYSPRPCGGFERLLLVVAEADEVAAPAQPPGPVVRLVVALRGRAIEPADRFLQPLRHPDAELLGAPDEEHPVRVVLIGAALGPAHPLRQVLRDAPALLEVPGQVVPRDRIPLVRGLAIPLRGESIVAREPLVACVLRADLACGQGSGGGSGRAGGRRGDRPSAARSWRPAWSSPHNQASGRFQGPAPTRVGGRVFLRRPAGFSPSRDSRRQRARRATGFLRVPIPSMVMLTTSPAASARSSGTRMPVPVDSTVPAGIGL